jgi:hypothetical protein
MKLNGSKTSVDGLHPSLFTQLFRIDGWCRRHLGYELIITGGTERMHSNRSRHYVGTDIDMRTWTTEKSGTQITGDKRKQLLAKLKRFLGPDWFVLDESTHFHLSWRPLR